MFPAGFRIVWGPDGPLNYFSWAVETATPKCAAIFVNFRDCARSWAASWSRIIWSTVRIALPQPSRFQPSWSAVKWPGVRRDVCRHRGECVQDLVAERPHLPRLRESF